METHGLSRREFLMAANAAAFLLLVESCSLGPVARQLASPSVPVGGTPFEQALKLLLDAVRASPDHLAQRSTDLVAGRDATKIVEFVRDRIAVLPTAFFGDDPRTARRWGATATLRAGQGTLRERADVLADMLTRAGFTAKVMEADLPKSIGLDTLYQPRAVGFSPDPARIDLAKSLLHQAGLPAPASPQPFDAGPDPVATILGLLPVSLQKATLRADLQPTKVPVVSFMDSGKTRYAFALGDLGISDSAPGGLAGYADADATRNVTVTVSAVANPAPGSTTQRGRLIDLVSTHWPAEQVVGHQVLLTFVPPQGPKAILDSGLDALAVRIPILRLQTDLQPTAAGQPLTAAGSVITVQGDVLGPSVESTTPTAGTPFDGPFGPIQVPSDADRSAAIARATTIKVSANAAAFPEIELEVAVTDGKGAPVDGLDGASFSVKEQGAAVNGFTLYSNVRVQQRPRVLIVSDAGDAQLWPSATVKIAFETGLDSAIVAQAAKTPFDVQVVTLGTSPTAGGWAAPQAGAIASVLSSAHESADDTWVSVGGPALEQGVAAIVLVSDMDILGSDPVKIPTYQRRLLASRVPVFALPIGAVDETTLAQILSMSGGMRLNPTDPSTPAKVAALLASPASQWLGGSYRLRYQAPATGPAQRTVAVGLSGHDQPRGNATYQVPANPLPPPSFSGLYVTIQHGSTTSVRRLAGLELDPRFGGPIGALDDPTAVAETRAAIDGITTIAVEPGTPTAAALLDDVLSSCLAIEPLRAIWGTGFTSDQFLTTFGSGVRRFPGAFANMLRSSNVDPKAPPVLKVAILQERVASSGIELHADLAVGMNQVIPVTTDPHAGFTAALTTSIGASAAEGAAFSDSAYTRLSGRHLISLVSGDYAGQNNFLKTVPPARLAAWQAILRIYDGYHIFAPDAGGAEACWVVDPMTGVAKSVLLDSTGGGMIHTACNLEGIDQLAIALATLAVICGAGGEEIYPFFCVGVNTAATGMAAALSFSAKHRDVGTPFSLLIGIFNPMGGMAGLNTAVGVMLIIITYQAAGC